MLPRSWQSLAEEKQRSTNAKIPPRWRLPASALPSLGDESNHSDVTEHMKQYLNIEEIQITETCAVEILHKIRCGKWKALDVTRAFCHRAALAHQFVCRPPF